MWEGGVEGGGTSNIFAVRLSISIGMGVMRIEMGVVRVEINTK
jgi:hypothetical protein